MRSETKRKKETMEKCNNCKKIVKEAPFGQCDDCFEKSMSENGSVIYEIKENNKEVKNENI